MNKVLVVSKLREKNLFTKKLVYHEKSSDSIKTSRKILVYHEQCFFQSDGVERHEHSDVRCDQEVHALRQPLPLRHHPQQAVAV